MVELQPDAQTLRPLPLSLSRGLLAVSVCASISFVTSGILLLYLFYKLLAWWIFVRHHEEGTQETVTTAERGKSQDVELREAEEAGGGGGMAGLQRTSSQIANDFRLGIEGIFTENPQMAKPVAKSATSVAVKSLREDRQQQQQQQQHHDNNQDTASVRSFRRRPNQFLLLIINLLLGDLHTSVGFSLNASWVDRNAIVVGSASCFTQGLFVSTGDLACSFFISLVAIHTYMSVVLGRRPSDRTLYWSIGFVWFFVYFVSAIPIWITHNGAAAGGYYTRAGAWCWVNEKFENTRLLTHYLWIFIALATTSGLYITIWWTLRRRARLEGGDAESADHHPAFLIYPVIYIASYLPLASGRLATMVGGNVPLEYLCFAGAMVSLNGLFDVLLFGSTRHAILFASRDHVDREDTGVGTIAFLQTPRARRYGNMIWVEGAGRRRQVDKATGAGGWWSWQRLAGHSSQHHHQYHQHPHHHHHHYHRRGESKADRSRYGSQETLRGPGIIMDTVTSIVVERETAEERIRYPKPVASTNASLSSIDVETIRL